MTQLNAFVPIMPFGKTEKLQPKAYENYLNYLRMAGAVTNLADSIAYRWVDNPKMKEIMFQGGKGGPLLPFVDTPLSVVTEGGEIMNEPNMQSKGSTIETPSDLKPFGRMTANNSDGGAIKVRAGLPYDQAQKTFAHEVDHLVSADIMQDSIRRGKGTNFYDRLTGEILPGGKAYINRVAEEREMRGGNSLGDTYDRSAHEIRAQSASMEEKVPARSGYGREGKAAPPEQQVIALNSRYMQNPKLINEAAQAFKRMAKMGKSALGGIGGLIDLKSTVDLLKDVGKYGVQSDAPYKKYLGEEINDGMI